MIQNVGEKQSDHHTQLLMSWSTKFNLKQLYLVERFGNHYHCLWSLHAKKQFTTDLFNDTLKFSVSERFLVIFNTKNSRAFQSFLSSCLEWLPFLFEEVVHGMQQLMMYTLWKQVGCLNHTAENAFMKDLLDLLVNVLCGVDAALYFKYNTHLCKFVIYSATGLDSSGYQKISFSKEEFMIDTTCKQGIPVIYNKNACIQSLIQSLTVEHSQRLKEAGIPLQSIRTLLLLPITIDDEAEGMILLYSTKFSCCLTKDTATLLFPFMNHCMLLLEQTRYKHLTKKTQHELDITYRALRTEHTQLRKTLDLYNILTTLVRNNKGIKEIMRELYSMMQTPVTYFDELLLPIASCGTTDKHRLPENFLATREARYVVRVKKWQVLTLSTGTLLLIIPVVGAERVIGFLCAWIDETTFNDSDRTLLEYSASIIGLDSMKREAIDHTKRQLFGDIFEQIISNTFSETMLQQAKNLDLNENDLYAVLVCDYQSNCSSGINKRFASESCLKWLEQTIHEMNIKGLVAHRRNNIIAFLSFSNQTEKRTIDEKLSQLCTRLNTCPSAIKIGIGRIETGFMHINQSYNDAKQCIQLLAKKKAGKVYRYSNDRIEHLLMNHDPDELQLYVSNHLGLLIEHDERRNKDLFLTLLAYLKHNRQLQETASALVIHPNTLYYRLGQIEKILSINLSNTEDWMNLVLACKIHQFLMNE
ncbi:MAG: helix-turn-helix domain-containing protein [Sporolactobacillus sp.]